MWAPHIEFRMDFSTRFLDPECKVRNRYVLLPGTRFSTYSWALDVESSKNSEPIHPGPGCKRSEYQFRTSHGEADVGCEIPCTHTAAGNKKWGTPIKVPP